jgi:hypothetical protein
VEAKENPPGSGGLIDRVTGLRVFSIIITNHHPGRRDAVHECKTCFNKKRLGEDASNNIN